MQNQGPILFIFVFSTSIPELHIADAQKRLIERMTVALVKT